MSIAITPQIEQLLNRQCVVAVGVSGGKDSVACALVVAQYLDSIGHIGPRVLIHSDLGRVEWQDSLPCCERLAKHIGWELVVVKRKAGDMLARWQGRWANNVARYADLACVKLILPWSTPSMRFCTSELKVDVITAALKKRWPDRDIVNVSGIRRQESANRARMPVAAPMAKLQRKAAQGWSWNPIIEYRIEQVFEAIKAAELPLHEAYERYGASRVSCAYCIFSTVADLQAAAQCAGNHDVYVSMVELEAASSFAFQGARWLADVNPHLLSAQLLTRITAAKQAAQERTQAESELPRHLLYTSGWPTALPKHGEAELIASVRRRVASALGLSVQCTTAASVLSRYESLMAARPCIAA